MLCGGSDGDGVAWADTFLSGLMLILIAAGAASASEARPWLCRDKPVFSSSGPSRMDLSSHDSRHWQVFLMQFDPSGGHDGFSITNNYDLGARRKPRGRSADPGPILRGGAVWIGRPLDLCGAGERPAHPGHYRKPMLQPRRWLLRRQPERKVHREIETLLDSGGGALLDPRLPGVDFGRFAGAVVGSAFKLDQQLVQDPVERIDFRRRQGLRGLHFGFIGQHA